MTSLLFIIVVTSVLILLIYWVLSTIKETDKIQTKIPRFKYEIAQELAVYGESELYVPENTVKFTGQDAKSLFAYWNMTREKFNQVAEEYQIDPDPERIVLRLYEVSDWLRYYDIKVKSMAGRCRFELQAGVAYYVVLGVRKGKEFIPILASPTICKPGV